MRLRIVALSFAIGIALTGCSSGASKAVPTPEPSKSSAAPALTGTEVSVAVTGDIKSEPVVSITPGDPASKLTTQDIAVGTGPAVKAGATVTANYVGYGAASGQMFDSSWHSGTPPTFPLGNVILGWQKGLVGMQVGGRRLLIIPAELGYGNAPPPGSGIANGETLVFVVDLVSFK